MEGLKKIYYKYNKIQMLENDRIQGALVLTKFSKKTEESVSAVWLIL